MLVAVTGHVAYRPRCHVKVRLVPRTQVAVFATAAQHVKGKLHWPELHIYAVYE